MSVLLYSAVDYDVSTNLYTYSYGVIKDSPTTVLIVDIFVGAVPTGFIQPIPTTHTEPDGWTMYGAFSGSIAGPPYNMNGGFYEWYAYQTPIPSDANSTFGFTLTTRFAPTINGGANDYFIFGSDGIVAYGNVIVPSGADWRGSVPSVPEPATWLMFIIGFAAIASLTYLRRNNDNLRGVRQIQQHGDMSERPQA